MDVNNADGIGNFINYAVITHTDAQSFFVPVSFRQPGGRGS
jgi:hypothetical protein